MTVENWPWWAWLLIVLYDPFLFMVFIGIPAFFIGIVILAILDAISIRGGRQ